MKCLNIALIGTASLLVLSTIVSCYSSFDIPSDNGEIPEADGDHPYPDSNIEPLVLFFRTLTYGADGESTRIGPLPVYDRHGKKIADLAKNLPKILGSASYEILEMTVHETVFIPPYYFVHQSPMVLPGQTWTNVRTQVVLKVRTGENDSFCRVIGLDTYGEATFDMNVDERWGEFQLSPRGRYVLGRTYSDGAIFDSFTGETIQEGPYLKNGVFAPDDSTFVFVDRSGTTPTAFLLSLLEKKERFIPASADLGSDLKYLTIKAAINQGFLFEIGCEDWHGRLWLLDHDDRWISFHKNPEANASETLIGLADEGRKVIFSRSPVSDGSQLAPGFYSFDPEKDIDDRVEPLIVNAPPFTPAGSWQDDYDACYAQDRMLFIQPTADEHQLVAWPFNASTPEVIGKIGPLPHHDGESGGRSPWFWHILRTSDNGAIIAVDLLSLSAIHPEVIPEAGMIILDGKGNHLLSFPLGDGILDRTGRLFVHQPMGESGGSREQTIIADIQRRSVSRHNIEELHFAMIYRNPQH